MKRSNEPIFWSIFGAGGMLVAIFLPILMVLSFFITSVSGAEQLTSESLERIGLNCEIVGRQRT